MQAIRSRERLRIAFLTPEFVTEYATGGGLGNYLNRMTRALLEQGHEPEIFVISDKSPGRIDFQGVTVHRVTRADRHLAMRAAWRTVRLTHLDRLGPLLLLLSGALGLATALRRREREAPFDFVQSSDYRAAGFFVGRNRRRPHLVRCSSAADLYAEADHDQSGWRRWETRLDLAAVRRADIAYAPSAYVADHLRRTHHIDMKVVRPPFLMEALPEASPATELPERYLFHFGQLIARKGTACLAEALPLAWAQEPELTMVWMGRSERDDLERWSSGWGRHRDKVRCLGAMPKPQVYAALRRAEATVLPSLVDNLPNTVIESLMMGVPVIGSAGASIDEIVEPGITGELVPIGDPQALAAAMIGFWRGESEARRGFTWQSGIAREMQPEHAVKNLLEIAGKLDRTGGRSLAGTPT